jgi:hypothetical protein
LFTDDRKVYEERCFGHYIRGDEILSPNCSVLPSAGWRLQKPYASAQFAFGLVQLKLYDAQMHTIQKAMNYSVTHCKTRKASDQFAKNPNSSKEDGLSLIRIS